MISAFLVIMILIVSGMYLERQIRHWKSGWLIVGPSLEEAHTMDYVFTREWRVVQQFKKRHGGYIIVKVYPRDNVTKKGVTQ